MAVVVALPDQVRFHMRQQSEISLTRPLQTLTATVPRLDHRVRSAPHMAAARGPPPHRPPAHPTARRTAQDLRTGRIPVMIPRGHS